MSRGRSFQATSDMQDATQRIEDLQKSLSIQSNKADNKALAEQCAQSRMKKAAEETQSVTDIQLTQMKKAVDAYRTEIERMYGWPASRRTFSLT